tara:strand:+ start:287 stop:391 length:105 start_codon:yes stop_codon:yes gene_type:complete
MAYDRYLLLMKIGGNPFYGFNGPLLQLIKGFGTW